MDLFFGNDRKEITREEAEVIRIGRANVERVKERIEREICERIDERRAGKLPPLVLAGIQDGRPIWEEARDWKRPGRVRGRKVRR